MTASRDHAAAASDRVRQRYNRIARFYDAEQSLMERIAGKWRREIWSHALGDVLEVGVGTGLNVRFYPAGSLVTAIDIAENMIKRAEARAAKLGAAVELSRMDAQHLDFPDATFDCAVATFVFCSVPDPIAGLREVHRVLKPGGTLLLLEHVRSENRLAGKLMDLMNPIVVRLAGANINRRTVRNVDVAGFDTVAVSSRVRGIVKLIRART